MVGSHERSSRPTRDCLSVAREPSLLRRLLVRLAMRCVVVLGRGLDAGERLPALGAWDWLGVGLPAGGRVVARFVRTLVVVGGWLRWLALPPPPRALRFRR